MKKLLTGLAILTGQLAFGQKYEELINKAGEALHKKDFCNALTIFQTAFKDSSKIGVYDLAYAALAATNCDQEKLALVWLNQSQQKGLGSKSDEIDFISSDSGFVKLHSYPEWSGLITKMRTVAAQKQKLRDKIVAEWVSTINKNKVIKAQDGRFTAPNCGFALYYSSVDSLKIPYLVYIPKSYNPRIPIRVIVYLHGGVVTTENFNFRDPDLATGEPIFSVGDRFNSIIIYPFGSKYFGWVAQKKAFENVLTIIKEVQEHYNINRRKLFIGGISNGGTATFWFASRKPNIFRGFYAFSAFPKLDLEPINFKNLSQGKPFYSINSKEDDVFKYSDVLSIYNAHRLESTDWHFETLVKGDHGFIYNPNGGKDKMYKLFEKLLIPQK